MKKKFSLTIVMCAGLSFASVVAAVYGPWYTEYDLATPMPTRMSIAAMEKKISLEYVSINWNDKVILCNQNVCITYTYTQSSAWLGGPATQQVRYPNLPDGPRYDNGDVRQGTGGSNSGSRPPSSGGRGSVEVRPLQPV
ncbi:hypothetical protein LL963_16525 [Xanthomonas campestris pv. esculenti]|nr:hypothetical protein [Xanthomonas campestris pv. esculenti]